MRYRLLLLILSLCLTIPLYAQDELSPYEIALQRIEEARISGATELDLSDLGLTEVPPEIGQLSNLQRLSLYNNQLNTLPAEIGQLINLDMLSLHTNQLTNLPTEIGQLSNLQDLVLSSNQLTNLPSEIGQLTKLHGLWLTNNQLQYLPTELGNLALLDELEATCAHCGLHLDGNPLISPPPEVVEQGTAAVLAYLRHQAWYHVQRLIIAAASGVGLLAVLVLGLRFRQQRGKSKKKRDDGSINSQI